MYQIIIRLSLAAGLTLLTLTGCDNRTKEAVRWDQIAQTLQKNSKVQRWEQAKSLWGNNNHYHDRVPW